MAEESTVKKDPPVVDEAAKTIENTETVKVEAPKVEEGQTAADALLPVKKEEEAVKVSVEDWPKYEHASLDAASSLMKDAGLSYADSKTFFQKSKETGKLEDVDVKGLEAKLGKEKARLVMAGVREYFNEQVELTKSTVSEVFKVLGGQEGFTKLQKWVEIQEAGDPTFAKDMAEYRKMINSGGVQAKAAAIALKQLYTQNPNNSGLNNKMVEGDTSVTTVDGQPLGRAEYNKLLKEAYDKRDDAEVARLNARRKAGLKQGVR